jgi:hypothetical protein
MSIKKLSETTLTSSGSYSTMGVGAVNWGAATGGTEVTNGGYKYHTFTSDGTLTVTQGGKFDCLLIAGGGGGGSSSADGGGAGEVVATCTVLEAGAINVDVGSGGVGGFGRNVFSSASVAQGNQGYPTIVGELYAIGGGGGGRTTSGGSGGANGGSSIRYDRNDAFSSGLIRSESHIGFNGGTTAGGGAGEAGETDGSREGGDGTAAFTEWAAATSTGENDGTGTYYYAGGGGGSTVTARGFGGLGGGGDGGYTVGENDNIAPSAGLANTGGGGGAGFSGYENRIIGGASGGSGIVIVRYEV